MPRACLSAALPASSRKRKIWARYRWDDYRAYYHAHRLISVHTGTPCVRSRPHTSCVRRFHALRTVN